ncbi:MAG: nickel-dependent lactate racemase [Candidatus Hydrogenedentes bacterium]|nr:nickel-dependent lactate racemase [Candidatus Hydrogenedentota bacterium]
MSDQKSLVETTYLAYGKGRLPLRMDSNLAQWTVVSPRHEAALPDARTEFKRACASPILGKSIRNLIAPGERVCIVTSDGTRPVPNRLLIPWIIEELGVPDDSVTVLVGTGTHRANTPKELAEMFGEDILHRVRVVNHDAYDAERNECVGTTTNGIRVSLDREYVRADKRIAVGFIEPHFFAGFSGGPKAIAPGVASLETILQLHRYELIAHPQSTWGVLDGNPVHEAIRESVALCPPDALVNVTLNADKEITAFFIGDYVAAHRKGCEHVRKQAMVAVPHAFPVVVTSNSGYPLDQNVYQAVKGMSAAAQIIEPGGTIFVASGCCDGIPGHGNFGSMLREADSMAGLDARLKALDSPRLDQWQAQLFAKICLRAEVYLRSSLDEATVRACKLTPVEDLQAKLEAHLRALGKEARVAVLPEGPVTVAYVSDCT